VSVPAKVGSCDFVVFGGTGDLALRKLFAAYCLILHRSAQPP
jgi:glucose-6-phosphate 1-dehydrogenase